MYNFDFIRKAGLISQTLIFLGTLATPATANHFGFNNLSPVDLNQSRQFFNQGNRQIEREIEILNRDKEPIEIKLPESFYLPQDFSQPNSLDRQQKLKLKSNK